MWQGLGARKTTFRRAGPWQLKDLNSFIVEPSSTKVADPNPTLPSGAVLPLIELLGLEWLHLHREQARLTSVFRIGLVWHFTWPNVGEETARIQSALLTQKLPVALETVIYVEVVLMRPKFSTKERASTRYPKFTEETA